MKKVEDEDLSFLEDDKKMSPRVMVLSGIFLVAAAAVICFFIWQLTHRDKSQEVPANGSEATQSVQEETTGAVTSGNSQDSGKAETLPHSSEASEPSGDNSGTQGAEDNSQTAGEGSKPADQNQGGTASSQPEQTGSQSGNEDALVFQEVNETVTAKEKTNLRSETSTESEVVVQIKNGETVTRTGINKEKGWSRLDYNGQTVYAVSQYLTTDLAPKKTEPEAPVTKTDGNTVTTQDGKTVTFTPCDDIVSPKNGVNLRTEPSTSQGNGTVKVKLEYKQDVHRTGIDEDAGWSRVEYNGEVLYVITSYIYVIEPEE